MHDLATRDDIARFIAHFYTQVRADELLAPHFAHVDWPTHTPRIVDFWESTVLHTGSFAGNVMEKHAELHRQLPLEPQHFQRWLQLFAHSLQQHFQGPNATLALTRAQGIAWLMENRVLGPKPPAPPT